MQASKLHEKLDTLGQILSGYKLLQMHTITKAEEQLLLRLIKHFSSIFLKAS